MLTKLNGVFLKVEINSAILSKHNIPNPFSDDAATGGFFFF
jgi:hypothetical protein